jgi:hypothetical protein
MERKARNFLGHKLWARGYFVSGPPEMADKLRLKLVSPQRSFITAFGGSHSNPQLLLGVIDYSNSTDHAN